MFTNRFSGQGAVLDTLALYTQSTQLLDPS